MCNLMSHWALPASRGCTHPLVHGPSLHLQSQQQCISLSFFSSHFSFFPYFFHFKDIFLTWGPPGLSRIIFLFSHQVINNLNSTCNFNFLLPCNPTYSLFQGLECGHLWEPSISLPQEAHLWWYPALGIWHTQDHWRPGENSHCWVPPPEFLSINLTVTHNLQANSTPRVPDSVNLGWGGEFAFLTSPR